VDRELEVAIAAARRAGVAIMDVYRREKLDVVQKPDDKGPLTEADLASDRILAQVLTSAFPDDGYLSEETVDRPVRLERSRCWIVDPLDGTREFTMGLPEFCVSVGLAVDGVATVGVVFNPVTDELVAGVVGKGCTLNGRPVTVTPHAALDGARFLVSRSEMEKGWFDAVKGKADLQPLGSVAWKFGLVAAGRSEGTFTPMPRNEWDLCGGVACVVAAGGRASDGKGAPYRFNEADVLEKGVCGTNGRVHDAVLALMRNRA
jgi:myo-inositol-1(or 4)-monophosphatase